MCPLVNSLAYVVYMSNNDTNDGHGEVVYLGAHQVNRQLRVQCQQR